MARVLYLLQAIEYSFGSFFELDNFTLTYGFLANPGYYNHDLDIDLVQNIT
jgi:hypothetical protein